MGGYTCPHPPTPTGINSANDPLAWKTKRQPSCLKFCLVVCALEQGSPIFLVPGTGFVKNNFSTDGGGGHTRQSSGRNAREASLTGPLLTSCYVAQLLTGHGPVPVHSQGVGDPCSRVSYGTRLKLGSTETTCLPGIFPCPVPFSSLPFP